MKISSKQLMIFAAVVLVIMIAVGIWFYRKGKKTTTIASVPNDVPVTAGGTNNPAGVSTSEISQIAGDLYQDMNGFNWLGHDSAPYEKLNSLSDTDFVNVYNTFNALHQSEGDGTLKKWIEDEDFAFDDVTQSILTRMSRLNLI